MIAIKPMKNLNKICPVCKKPVKRANAIYCSGDCKAKHDRMTYKKYRPVGENSPK